MSFFPRKAQVLSTIHVGTLLMAHVTAFGANPALAIPFSMGHDETGVLSSSIGGSTSSGRRSTNSRVVFKDAAAFETKRQGLIAGGSDSLQIISDFDFTLTKFWVNGKRGASCHMVISDSGLLTDEYHETTAKLRAKYYPMEMDTSLSKEERDHAMIEWVTLAHEAMSKAGMSRTKIAAAVSKASLSLRPGQAAIFKWVEKEGVPLLIFSGGIADVLEEIVRQLSPEKLPSTCEVISNRMNFDEDGSMVGFHDTMYHAFNKCASSALDSPYFKSDEVKRRRNILLIGDSLGDPGMVQGINASEVLKIGFLNDKVEERMQAYMEAYDAVILGDGDFGFVLDILDRIAGHKAPDFDPAR